MEIVATLDDELTTTNLDWSNPNEFVLTVTDPCITSTLNPYEFDETKTIMFGDSN